MAVSWDGFRLFGVFEHDLGEVAGLKVRVLVGSEDKVETVEKVREQTVQMLKAGGFDIEMDVVEGAGHLLPVEAIDEVVEALRKLVG